MPWNALGRSEALWGQCGSALGTLREALVTLWDAARTFWDTLGRSGDALWRFELRWECSGMHWGALGCAVGSRRDGKPEASGVFSRRFQTHGRSGTLWAALGMLWDALGTLWDASLRAGTLGNRKLGE